MNLNNDYIKLIFGLKLKRIRQSKKLSLSQLAAKSNLSVSYLNEIETGKKYPKADKIALLANSLNVPYDKLVSLKLSNALAPITDLLESGILEKLPLDHYGIDIRKLITLMSDAPLQLSALIATLIDLAKTSEMSKSVFSRTALRTFKEFHDNYFDDIEKEVKKFCKKYLPDSPKVITYELLSDILRGEYGYEIDDKTLGQKSEFSELRATVFNGKKKRLLLNPKLSPAQKKFVVGKELFYNRMSIKDRAYIYSDQNLETFDQLLNNYKASYFSTALILNKDYLTRDIKDFFSLEKFSRQKLTQIIREYDVSPEMLFQRIANLAPKFLGLNKFFFLRFNSKIGSDVFTLSKEVRLNISRNPGGYQSNEHYCRRWISIRTLEELKSKLKESPKFSGFTMDAIRSTFHNSSDKFLSISIAKPSKLIADNLTSVTLGFCIDENLKSNIGFWNDPKITDQTVNDTCEMCDVHDCLRRAAPPVSLQKREKTKRIINALHDLSAKLEDS
ncbi:MAG: helix-turn-helix domain-containing protein [Chlorobi bacterium]|nr:helix-turn-helix domain-containing protein [Chlorobiota bacterium]